MRVAFDVRCVVSSPAGVGQYALSLVRALATLENGPELLLFGDSHTHVEHFELGPNCRFMRLPAGWLWHEFARLTMRRKGAHLYHSPSSGVVPMSLRAQAVLTVHDLVPLLFPKTTTLKTRVGFRVLQRAVRRVGAVIAVSENTRDDILRIWNPGREIDVVHEAPRGLPEPQTAQTLEGFGVRQPYFLAVGTLEPRKNLSTLIRAWNAARKGRNGFPHLVIVGADGWGAAGKEVKAAAHAAPGELLAVGFRTDQELATLYHHARAFIAPSLYEGFGLPALEAMAAGVPVLAARAGALPEVLGDAALLFEPTDSDTLSQLLVEIVESDQTAADLSARGRSHAETFSWQRTARQTADIYERLRA